MSAKDENLVWNKALFEKWIKHQQGWIGHNKDCVDGEIFVRWSENCVIFCYRADKFEGTAMIVDGTVFEDAFKKDVIHAKRMMLHYQQFGTFNNLAFA